MQYPGYSPQPWSRPDFRVDGAIVVRRRFPGEAFEVGDIVPRDYFATERQLGVFWDNHLVDTLPPLEPPKPEPKKQAAPPQRGR